MPYLGGSVEGSMIRVPGRNLMLSASPRGIGPIWQHRCAGPGRCNMTVWASGDSGATWREHIVLNESLGINPRELAAYSTMVALNATHFALVYERSYIWLTMVYLPLPKQDNE